MIVFNFKCEKHGNYFQRVCTHIRLLTGDRKSGCPLCARERQAKYHQNVWGSVRHDAPQWFIDDLANEEDKSFIKSEGLKSSDGRDSNGKQIYRVYAFKCPMGHIYSQRVDKHIKLSTGELYVGVQSVIEVIISLSQRV